MFYNNSVQLQHLLNPQRRRTPPIHHITSHHINTTTMATTMKALVSAEGKKAEVQADVPIPQPGEGEIIVKVHSVAQNPYNVTFSQHGKHRLT
jgi:hypothetical protein